MCLFLSYLYNKFKFTPIHPLSPAFSHAASERRNRFIVQSLPVRLNTNQINRSLIETRHLLSNEGLHLIGALLPHVDMSDQHERIHPGCFYSNSKSGL